MRLTRVLRVSKSRFEDVINSARLSLNEAPRLLKQIKEEKQKSFLENVVQLNKWYMNVIGLNEVKAAQDKVMTLQDKLVQIQEKRRETDSKLNDSRISISDIHDEMSRVDKEANLNKYIQLRNQETEMLKIVQLVAKTYKEYDQTEKELFTALTSAIRDANERQRLQMEYTKYIGLILSLAGSFLTFFYATFRKEDLKKYMDKTLSVNKMNINDVNNVLLTNNERLRDVLNRVEKSNSSVVNALNANNKLVSDVIQQLSRFSVVLKKTELGQLDSRKNETVGLIRKIPGNEKFTETGASYLPGQFFEESGTRWWLYGAVGVVLLLFFSRS